MTSIVTLLVIDMQWCRLYAAMRHDPKVLALSDEQHRALINIWTIACETGGKLPSFPALCFELRMRSDKLKRVINSLISAGFIDQVGDHLEPHNWGGRQYKSDTSNERVARHRQNKRNGSVTLHETSPVTSLKRPQIQTTESDTERSKSPSDSCAVAVATRTDYSLVFNELWKIYPKRDGSNPKATAAKKLTAILRSGQVTMETILVGARRYRAEMERKQQVGTAYVAQLVTWLNQQRWGDEYNGSSYPLLDRPERPTPP